MLYFFISFFFIYFFSFFFFFFNDPATTEIYTLSLHDALPIFECARADRRAQSRAPVPDGLRRRVLTLARQRRRYRADLQLLPRPARLPAPRALLGRARRARVSRNHDRRRRGAARALRVDLLPVRGAFDLLGGAHARRQRGELEPRGEQALSPGAPYLPDPRRLRRAQVLHPAVREAAGDATLRGADVRRDLGRDVRGRLDPCDLRGHESPVPGVQLERVRGPRPAQLVFRARADDRALPLHEGEPRALARVRGREDDPRAPRRHPELRVAVRDPGHSRRRRARLRDRCKA